MRGFRFRQFVRQSIANQPPGAIARSLAILGLGITAPVLLVALPNHQLAQAQESYGEAENYDEESWTNSPEDRPNEAQWQESESWETELESEFDDVDPWITEDPETDSFTDSFYDGDRHEVWDDPYAEPDAADPFDDSFTSVEDDGFNDSFTNDPYNGDADFDSAGFDDFDPDYSGDRWPDDELGSESYDQEDFQDAAAVCMPNAATKADPITEITANVWNVVQWVEQPDTLVMPFLQDLGPQLTAQLQPVVWPDISDRARAARVPIMMYHDILAEKEVFFDVTPEEFEEDLQMIRDNGLTPISMDQLVNHLQTGVPLPPNPILLTFDDGYLGHYQYVLPLLQEYGYPGLFSIYTFKVGRDHGRPGVDWEQLQEMAADPLVTIAAHSVNHPSDLRELSDEDLRMEIEQSKQDLEERLGIPIDYFTYPEGNYDERVAEAVADSGFRAALTMNDLENSMAGESEDLLAIARIGQSQLDSMIEVAWGGNSLPRWGSSFDFTASIQKFETIVDEIPLTLISGGQPVTIHADSRYQVWEIIQDTGIEAAVDGGFFSLEYLDSNQMIGPVYSQNTNEFVPGDRNDVPFIVDRPLVLISPDEVRYIPFDPEIHNSLEGIQAEMEDVTDAFVAAAWLVRDGEAQPAENFGSLFDYDARRHRAFWGINQQGQPVVGATHYYVDSIHLGEILASLGLYDAVMLDSGASTSVAYQGESLMAYEPRPVPHIVGLVPDASQMAIANTDCLMARGLMEKEATDFDDGVGDRN